MGRDRAYAEWRFFTDCLLHACGNAWPCFMAVASDRRRFDPSAARRVRDSAASRPVRYRRSANQFQFPGQIKKTKGGHERHVRFRCIHLRQCSQGETGGGHQADGYAGPVIDWRNRAADSAVRPQRAGTAQSLRCAKRSRGQGARQDLAVPQGPVRPGSFSVSRCSNPRLPNPKLRGDRL